MLESFVDLINMAKLGWFCLKLGSCCELFCSDPSGRVQVLADLLLLPQELGSTLQSNPLPSFMTYICGGLFSPLLPSSFINVAFWCALSLAVVTLVGGWSLVAQQ